MEPMHLEIAQETEYFFLSCLLGAGLGIIYDLVRVFRNTVKHNKVLVFIEDFIYAAFFGFAFFLFGTDLTGGIRAFVLLGMFAGCMIERVALGNWAVKLISKVTGYIWNVLLSPIRGFFAKILAVINKRIVKKYLNFLKREKKSQKPLKV
ncbi:MAG: spore cortex biosynthesis protein YabQ [Ruminococcus sp.]|nr:spore cortex biosynthesis protein YabQ [Ruminococcus sp.]